MKNIRTRWILFHSMGLFVECSFIATSTVLFSWTKRASFDLCTHYNMFAILESFHALYLHGFEIFILTLTRLLFVRCLSRLQISTWGKCSLQGLSTYAVCRSSYSIWCVGSRGGGVGLLTVNIHHNSSYHVRSFHNETILCLRFSMQLAKNRKVWKRKCRWCILWQFNCCSF